ncbi:MAG: M56 family metallopeptidase, partial [Alteriqipengyuania sp.]
MSSDFHGFAIETLVWTGVLILVVLVLRRPVTRHFGPHAAYALWALPFMRLLLPPLVLPAWLAPASPPAPQPAGDPGSPATFYTLAETGEAPVAVPQLMKATVSIDWLSISLAVWLAGAGVFVMLRFFHYFAMRRDLLASGVEVGRRGKVRLVETAGAHSPIAFGVIDKVVALPRGFMERTDPIARDLAL